MPFVPDATPAKDVPFFENASTKDGGWQGHSSRSSVETLKREVQISLGRLGGSGVVIQAGRFEIGDKERLGFQISYLLSNGDQVMKSRLNIAALPLRKHTTTKANKTLKMALYMLRMALDGAWFLEQLSPGYAALIPWMLAPGADKTITEIWTQNTEIGLLLPPGEADFIEGEFK